MSEKELFDKLIGKIKLLNETVWEGKVKGHIINKWLQNFKQEKEKLHMLFLLSQFMYFSDRQIKSLLKSLYRDLFKYPIIEEFRKSNNNTTDITRIYNHFNTQLSKTRFIGIGDASESGQHLLYPFRQENSLSKELFINASDIISKSEILNEKGEIVEIKDRLTNPEVENYVFIDDFCGSGSQAKRYSKDLVERMKELKSDCKVIYLMLFGTDAGRDFIKNRTLFDSVDSVFELNESFKCFHQESRYFIDIPQHIDKEESKKYSLLYGEVLMRDICKLEKVKEDYIDGCAKENAHGFKNGQLLLGFSHNTPDNTLPVFWYNEINIEWFPIFKRYNKKY